jgi:hypothetical protein
MIKISKNKRMGKDNSIKKYIIINVLILERYIKRGD